MSGAAGDATTTPAIAQAMERAAATMPGALTSSYFSTQNLMYVSADRHTTFMNVYPAGSRALNAVSGAERLRAAAAKTLPAEHLVQGNPSNCGRPSQMLSQGAFEPTKI